MSCFFHNNQTKLYQSIDAESKVDEPSGQPLRDGCCFSGIDRVQRDGLGLQRHAEDRLSLVRLLRDPIMRKLALEILKVDFGLVVKKTPI